MDKILMQDIITRNSTDTKTSTEYSFHSLFNLEEIQKIQDELSYALRVGSIIVDPTGEPITKPSNYCEFCHKIVRSSQKGLENCKKSDHLICRPNKEGPIISNCLSAGLLDAGASIMLGDIHIASWIIGQIRDDSFSFDKEENIKKAISLGIDPDSYCLNITKVPTVSKEQFEHMANLIFIVAKQLSNLAMINHKKSLDIQKLILLEKQLKSEQERLYYLNTHDVLTGLYSRTFCEESLKQIEKEKTYPVSIIIGDVNKLKITNDVFSHQHGDILLHSISNILKSEADDDYIISRMGGDEFDIILPNNN